MTACESFEADGLEDSRKLNQWKCEPVSSEGEHLSLADLCQTDSTHTTK